MNKHQFMNKKTGQIGEAIIVTYDKGHGIESHGYEYIEDMMEEWAAHEPTPTKLTVTVECESEQEANRLSSELYEAQAIYGTWDKKNWETVIEGLKGDNNE